jgi:hypothetical protein
MNRKAEQVLPGVGGTSGKGEDVGKGWWSMNMVQIPCTHVCKCIFITMSKELNTQKCANKKTKV